MQIVRMSLDQQFRSQVESWDEVNGEIRALGTCSKEMMDIINEDADVANAIQKKGVASIGRGSVTLVRQWFERAYSVAKIDDGLSPKIGPPTIIFRMTPKEITYESGDWLTGQH